MLERQRVLSLSLQYPTTVVMFEEYKNQACENSYKHVSSHFCVNPFANPPKVLSYSHFTVKHSISIGANIYLKCLARVLKLLLETSQTCKSN